jgi:uncharacterized protein (DUF736 family)
VAEYSDENRGVLFKNDKKESEKHPDYTGRINVGGKEMRLAAWIKEGQKGKFMSLMVSEFQKQEAPKQTGAGKLADMSDDIPF